MNTKKVKKVTVITVCLNCVDTIALTLDSVSAQTYKNVEHVVIDGGSTDGTVDIVKRYHVGYFVSEADGGIYQAMAKGVKAASGDVLIFLNSGDVFYDTNVCEDVIAFFNETRADVIFGDFAPYLINPDDTYDHKHFTPDKICCLADVTKRTCLQHRNIHHQSLFYRYEIFDKCTYFSPEWPNGSDYELNVQALVQHGFSAKYFPRPVSKFALGGLTTSNFQREENEVAELTAMINRKYFSHPISFQENEYVYLPPSAQPSLIKRLLINSLPYRLKNRIIHRLSNLATQVISNALARQGLSEGTLTDFRKRSDAIYQVSVDLSQQLAKVSNLLAEQQTSQQETISDFQKCSDAIYQVSVDLSQQSTKVSNLLSKQQTRQQEAITDFQKRSDAIYQVSVDLSQQLAKVSNLLAEQQTSQQETISDFRKCSDSIYQVAVGQTGRVISSLGKLQQVVSLNLAKLINFHQADIQELHKSGYKITSQFDEDGIIQFLMNHLDIPKHIFVEFGVENYTEANTRLLIEKDNWSGLIIDGNEDYVSEIKRTNLYCLRNLQAITAFITRDNINKLISGAGITGDIGLLSIDIDGVDYWIWEKIDIISPRIVVCEYNSIFGPDVAVTIPYTPDFDRSKAHYSHLYAGASLEALVQLGKKKNYSLVGSNFAGNNAFFVRNDCLADLKVLTAKETYVKAQFRESRDTEGKLSYLPIEKGIKLVGDLPVFDVLSKSETKIRELEINYD